MEHVAEDLAVTSETARHQPVDGVDLTKVQKPVGAGAPKYTNPRRTRAVVTLSVLVVTLVAVTIVSAGLGQYNIPTDQVLASFARKWGFIPPQQEWAIADSTLWNVRFPRVLLALFVGAALGCSGAVMQAVFGNPLAEPGVVGISSGAAVGACLAIVLGPQLRDTFAVPTFAFVGALTATVLVYVLSRSGGRSQVVSMILTGIAVTAVANAAIAFCVYVADSTSRDEIVFWQMGSLNRASWTSLSNMWFVVVAALLACFMISGKLDLLALGERAAQHSGVNVERLRMLAIAATALLTGAAVAHSGIIAFVGLIIPHLLRLMLGPSNRVLLPASALGGALLVSLSDLVARTLIPFSDMPIGIFTALVGGPTFFFLLRRSMRKGGV